jgi:uncharacterized protein (DUF58 family)
MATRGAQSLQADKDLFDEAFLEFADHRTYAPGDDMRYLDWSVYGRTEKLLLRLFQEEEDLSIYLLVDVSESMRFGDPPKADYAKRVAAGMAYVGLANLDRVGITPFAGSVSGRLPPARGKAQIFKILDFLRGAKAPKAATDLRATAANFVLQNKRRGLVMVASDFYDPKGYQDGLNFLRYHKYDVLAIHVYDPAEATPELSGDLELVDCESGEGRQVTISAAVLEAYRKEHAKYLDEVRDFCSTHQIGYVRAPIDLPFDELILKVFREGGLVR